MPLTQLISQALVPIRRHQFASELKRSVKEATVREVVSTMVECPRVNRHFDPFGVAAALVSHLPTDDFVKREALGQLIHSQGFKEALQSVSHEEWKSLRQSRPTERSLPPQRVVDSCLAEGVLSWKGQPLRDALRCIVQAQGLVPAVLALERWHGGVSDIDSAEAERTFRRWEDNFGKNIERFRRARNSSMFSLPTTAGADHCIDEEEFQDPSTALESCSALQTLYEGLRPMLRRTGDGKNQDPILLTQYLRKQDNDTVDRINSLPRTLISAHFGLKMGIDLQVYLGSDVTTLFYPALQTVLDYWIKPSGFLMTPDEAQRTGLFVDHQQPAPVEAIFAGVLRNLANFQEKAEDKLRFYRAALEVYRDDFASRIGIASLYPGTENLLLQVIYSWRRNSVVNERLALFYAREGHYSKAREHVQDAIFSLIAHREAAKEVFHEFMDVTLWPSIGAKTLARLKHLLARIHDQEGSRKEAIREIREALALDPQNSEASLDLERMLMRN